MSPQRATHGIPAAVWPPTSSLFIVNPLGHLRARAVRLFSTHPSTEERVERLMAMTPSGGRPRWSQSFAL
jgi:Zn-dependent protease with chaperone function